MRFPDRIRYDTIQMLTKDSTYKEGNCRQYTEPRDEYYPGVRGDSFFVKSQPAFRVVVLTSFVEADDVCDCEAYGKTRSRGKFSHQSCDGIGWHTSGKNRC